MNLKKIWGTLALAIPLSVAAQQVVVVDDAHLQMGPGGPNPAIYKVSASTTIALDARTYKFKISDELAGKAINSVQVIAGKTLQYSATWNEKERVTMLSSATLHANPGTPAFAGFPSGQRVVIAIGNLDGRSFNVVWVGLVDVN
jgi:hypothetical protein